MIFLEILNRDIEPKNLVLGAIFGIAGILVLATEFTSFIPGIVAVIGCCLATLAGVVAVMMHENFSSLPLKLKILSLCSLISGGAGGTSILAMQLEWIVDTTIYFEIWFMEIGITTILLAVTGGFFFFFLFLLIVVAKFEGYDLSKK